MYAVVEIGSFQFKVSEGDTIDAYRLDEEVGKKIDLDKVVLFANGDDIKIGQPYVKGAKVQAEIIRHNRGAKVIAYQYRRRHDSKRKVGHRQDLTALRISKISAK